MNAGWVGLAIAQAFRWLTLSSQERIVRLHDGRTLLHQFTLATPLAVLGNHQATSECIGKSTIDRGILVEVFIGLLKNGLN